MAYAHSNAAREIACIKKISTRNLLMVLASAANSETHSGFHSAGCLMHWSGLVKSTFYQAVDELKELGILKTERRRKGNKTNVWKLDIDKMESMRVSWQSIKPKNESELEAATDDSGMGLPKGEPDEAEMAEWASSINRFTECNPGTTSYWTLSKVQDLVDQAGSDFQRVKEVVETLETAAVEGKIDTFLPHITAKPKQRVGAAEFQRAWPKLSAAFDKVVTNRAFQLEE